MMSHPELKTICDLLRWGASSFNQAGLTFGHGTDNVFDEALVLVSHALHLPLQFPEHYLGAHVTAQERDAALALIQQRIETRKPSAYLTHEAWFAGLPFYVDERVLVPRSPLAERIERYIQALAKGELTVQQKAEFEALLGPDKDKTIVVYCGFVKCTRSHNGAAWALKLGYTNVYRHPGGIFAWKGAAHPMAKEAP